jgi:ATP-dependent DNA helicase RecG
LTVLKIPRAPKQPVQFKGQEFIRSGSYKKKLKDFPEKERALWRSFESQPFERLVAAEQFLLTTLLGCSTTLAVSQALT